jgi:DNA polymerase-3 subunit alpha
MQKYVSLHNHTTASLLDGITPPAELAKRAAELEFSAVAITDHGSISGAIKFYKACKEYKINPIVGIEAYLCDDVSKKKGEKNYHIVLLVKSERGLKSLYRLMTKGHDNFYYRPRIDMDMLGETEDLIAMTACAGGILKHPQAEKLVLQLWEKFRDDLYIEIMDVDYSEQAPINALAVELHELHGIKLVATGDAHYLKPEDSRLHNFLLGFRTNDKMQFTMDGLYLKTYDQMLNSFADSHPYLSFGILTEALANTLEVAEKCNLEIAESPIVLPQLTEDDPAEVLDTILKKQIPIKFPYGWCKNYQERLDYEFGIIKEKGFIEYFLLVYEKLIKPANENGIQLGWGRGSAGGSLICYLLGIVGLDPIEEDLMFERFLNPERTDYPDIDLDFPQSKRGQIIEWLREDFGPERVSYISTVSELRPTSAFKDVARKFNVPFLVANEISAKIDNAGTFAEVVEAHPGIRRMIGEDKIDDIIYFTDGITGTLRHEATHAAGIVVAPSRIEDFGILERRKDTRSINWDMNDVSFWGLVKIDVLGLRTLDVIAEALALIEKRHKTTVDWRKVSFGDPELLNEFALGNTIGIFQFEKGATRRLVKRLFPIYQKSTLVDCNALVRPGPLDSGMTESYIGRHTGANVTYDEPYIEYLLDGPGADIANNTYQVLIYQEQVTAVLQKLAGYSIPQADIIRRIFAKKKGDFEIHRKPFVKGCKKTVGMPADVANALFNNLETFSRYGFNKAHAAAYTQLGLCQMYLKVNYPLEYMTALFKYTTEKDKKLKFVEECYRLGIKLEAPDINASSNDFKIEKNHIRIGLAAIKGVGEKVLSHIETHRKMRSFKDVTDFRLRIKRGDVGNGALTSMILAGCFDNLNINQKGVVDILATQKGKTKLLVDFSEAMEAEDYPGDMKELNKATLIPGIWKANILPELGLNLDVERLEMLREFIGACEVCSLRKAYDCPVSFEYSKHSRIMVVCEAPGQEETESGRPLMGRAGDELIIHKMGAVKIHRQELFMTNAFKCRPLGNKIPKDVPLDCHDILRMEIDVLQPKFIFALGNRAREFFTGQATGIQDAAERLRCEVEIVDGRPIPVLYSVHPASCLYPGADASHTRLEKSVEVLASIKAGTYQEEMEDNEEDYEG